MEESIEKTWEWQETQRRRRRRPRAAASAASLPLIRARHASEVDSWWPASTSIIQHATAAVASTRPDKGSAHCGTYQAPAGRQGPLQSQGRGAHFTRTLPTGSGGRERSRAVVARYVNRVWARSARSRALGAGSRAECRHGVMQRAATVARTGKIEREGRGSCARRRIDTAAPPQPRPPVADWHYRDRTTRRTDVAAKPYSLYTTYRMCLHSTKICFQNFPFVTILIELWIFPINTNLSWND